MTSFLRHAFRSSGLTAADKCAAESVLGRGHRLTRALSGTHTLALQSIVAAFAVLASVAALRAHLSHTVLALVVASVVAGAFVLAWLVAWHVTRARVQDLIASGDDSVVLPVVARERRRLASRKERERVARSLDGLYRDALRWHEILPQFRPPDGVFQLRHVGDEVAALTRALRGDRVRVQGVALAERFLSDGYASPLYSGELEPLREELNRIRYLVETEAAVDAPAERREAA